MEEENYQLVIRVNFKAIDNIQARMISKDIAQHPVEMMKKYETKVKLQKIYQDCAPENVQL